MRERIRKGTFKKRRKKNVYIYTNIVFIRMNEFVFITVENYN